jgi:hypothetical protein
MLETAPDGLKAYASPLGGRIRSIFFEIPSKVPITERRLARGAHLTVGTVATAQGSLQDECNMAMQGKVQHHLRRIRHL